MVPPRAVAGASGARWAPGQRRERLVFGRDERIGHVPVLNAWMRCVCASIHDERLSVHGHDAASRRCHRIVTNRGTVSTMIELRDVSKRYGDVEILHPTTLSLDHGVPMNQIGASGAAAGSYLATRAAAARSPVTLRAVANVSGTTSSAIRMPMPSTGNPISENRGASMMNPPRGTPGAAAVRKMEANATTAISRGPIGML